MLLVELVCGWFVSDGEEKVRKAKNCERKMHPTVAVLILCVMLAWWTAAIEAKPLQMHSSSAVSTLPRSLVSPHEKLLALRGGDSKAGRQIRGKKVSATALPAMKHLSP